MGAGRPATPRPRRTAEWAKADAALEKPSVDRRAPLTVDAGNPTPLLAAPTADITLVRVTCTVEFGTLRLSSNLAPLTVAEHGKNTIKVANSFDSTQDLRVVGGTVDENEDPIAFSINGTTSNTVLLAPGEAAEIQIFSDTEFLVVGGTVASEA